MGNKSTPPNNSHSLTTGGGNLTDVNTCEGHNAPQPAISIIVPVYNTRNYLEECIESLICQTLHNIEIIIIDDGSTDGSSDIIDAYAQSDHRIRVIHNSNKGVSASRNCGIDMATGKYIMFVDGDDWIDPQMCQTMYDAALLHDVDLVICGNYNVSSASTTSRCIFPCDDLLKGDDYKNRICVATLGLAGSAIRNIEKLDRLTPVWARLYRRISINSQTRFIDLNKLPSECLQFNFEYSVAATSAAYVNKPLYYYRRNTAMSVTKPFRSNLLEKWKWWIEYAEQYITKHCNEPSYWAAYHSRVCSSVIPLGGNAMKLKKLSLIVAECKKFLNDKAIIYSLKQTDFSKCKIHWRLFFWSVKSRNVYLFVLLTWCMRKILSRRKS